jgi:hypothetical protein
MPRLLSLEDLEFQCAHYAKFGSRAINAVHLNHTWVPAHRTWCGSPSMRVLARGQIENNGDHELSAHYLIDPKGNIFGGRPLCLNPPVPLSAAGANFCSPVLGPARIDVVGNFHVGADRLLGPQRQALIECCVRILYFRQLPASPQRIIPQAAFDSDMSSGIGTSIARVTGSFWPKPVTWVDGLLEEIAASLAAFQPSELDAAA